MNLKNYFNIVIAPMKLESTVKQFLNDPDIQRKFTKEQRDELFSYWLTQQTENDMSLAEEDSYNDWIDED